MKTYKFYTLLLFVFILSLGIVQAQNKKKKTKERKTEAISEPKTFDLSYLKKEGDEEDFDLSEFDMGAGENYLLIIAVDKYQYWKSLKNPVKDAQDVKKVLTKKYGFKAENTYELYNEDVSAENVRQVFEKVRDKGTSMDNLLIYYSGHGHYDPSFDEGYWVPHEGKNGAVSSYIPNTNVRNYIKAMQHRHIFLIADACFSGALFSDAHRGYVEKMEQIQSRWGLTSGNLEYVSDGKDGQNSPFATYLIKFLKENLKDKFPVSELVQYVKTAVADNTEQTPMGNPLRGVGNEGGEFIFRVN